MKRIINTVIDELERFYYKCKFKLIDDGYYVIKRYLINIYKFRKELSKAYPWNEDYGLLRKQIELMLECKKNGYEIETTANKKIAKMERAIFLLKCFEKDDFIEIAEKELGYEYNLGNWSFNRILPTDDMSEEDKEHYTKNELYQKVSDIDDNEEIREKNNRITQRTLELELEYWNELWDIMKGQDYTKFDKNIDFDQQFDGSGYNTWWD